MMDDDNISAAITHGGGGGITLHSRWKSQFDDSEGCSDNETEMKGEQLQSPEHIKQEAEGKDGDQDDMVGRTSSVPAEKRSPMPRENPPKPPTLNLSPSPKPGQGAATSNSLMSPNLSKGMLNRPPQYVTQHSVPGSNTTAVATTYNTATTTSTSHNIGTSTGMVATANCEKLRSPMPKENPPKPPTLNLSELQHSASAPSMKHQLSPPATATSASGCTTASLPPPPQFRPPPPPATAALASSNLATTTNSSTTSTPAASGHQQQQTCNIKQTSTTNFGSTVSSSHHQITGSSTNNDLLVEGRTSCHSILSKRLLPQTGGHGREPGDSAANATHDPNNIDAHDNDDDEDEDDVGDEEDEEEDDDEEEGGEGGEAKEEYVAAVCHYTTILKDAPPGFDNDDYEVNYHHLNEQDVTTEDNDGGPANDHTSPGQNWSSPQINRTSNFVFTQKEGFRLRASAKVEDPMASSGGAAVGVPQPVSTSAASSGYKFKVSTETTDTSRSRPVVRSSSSDRILDSSEYAHQILSTQDDSSDVPQAVFIRPPGRMRIFQTEVEDDEDDEDREDDDEEEDDDDDEPPIPPPRSKSKESSLSTGPLASRHRTKDGSSIGAAELEAASRSPNERSVYFDATDQQHIVHQQVTQCHDPSSVASSSVGGHGPQRRTTPAGQDRSLGSFRESQNVESVEKKEIVSQSAKMHHGHHSEVASSGGDSCSRSCSDHSNKHPHSTSSGHHRRGTRSSRKHQTSKSGSSSRGDPVAVIGGGVSSASNSHHQSARRISLDDLSSAFQALISNSSAAVAASMTKKKSNHSSRASTKSLMNRSFVTQPAIGNDCCQSDNGGLGDNSRGSPAERMRSRSEENLLESRSTVSLASSHQRYEDRGISCSPASLKQSISIRSNDSSVGSGRLNLSSRYGTLVQLS